jgi:ribosomal protein S18 acetylase RimI-like enzyme
MQLEFRRLTSGDEATLDRVADGVFDETIKPDRLASYLSEPGHHMIVALYVDEVGVAPASRRRGIARELLDRMLALGKTLGCEEAWIGTERDNDAARALYGSYAVPTEQVVMYTFRL